MSKTLPLMPMATAVWLIENTTLTFEQIGDFCGLHSSVVQGIADGFMAKGVLGINPTPKQLTRDEIKRCEADPTAELSMIKRAEDMNKDAKKSQKGKYTPRARRQDKPDAIAWLLKIHPELTPAQIVRLIGTTKHTIESVKNKSHWNSQNIRAKDPVLLGLCTQAELDRVVEKAQKAQEKLSESN